MITIQRKAGVPHVVMVSNIFKGITLEPLTRPLYRVYVDGNVYCHWNPRVHPRGVPTLTPCEFCGRRHDPILRCMRRSGAV